MAKSDGWVLGDPKIKTGVHLGKENHLALVASGGKKNEKEIFALTNSGWLLVDNQQLYLINLPMEQVQLRVRSS